MYIKARLLRNKIIPAQISAINPQYIQSQKRWRRATITYGLLVLSFSSFASLVIVRIVLVSIFEKSVVSRSVSVCVVYSNWLSAMLHFHGLWNLAFQQGYTNSFSETGKAN